MTITDKILIICSTIEIYRVFRGRTTKFAFTLRYSKSHALALSEYKCLLAFMVNWIHLYIMRKFQLVDYTVGRRK